MSHAGSSHEPYVDFLLGIEDVSCLVSDALRELGVGGAVGLPAVFPLGSHHRSSPPRLRRSSAPSHLTAQPRGATLCKRHEFRPAAGLASHRMGRAPA